jgi:hypothetical protein
MKEMVSRMKKYSIIEINEIKAKILKMYIKIQELKSRFRTISYEFQVEDGFGHEFETGTRSMGWEGTSHRNR